MIAKNKNNDKSLKQINKKSFTTIDAVVEEFVNITNLLPSHGFKKRNGHSPISIFKALFYQAFYGSSNLFRFADSDHFKNFDISSHAAYRLLNNERVNWSKLLLSVGEKAIRELVKCNKVTHINALVIDDTPYERAKAKNVEGASSTFDHVSGRNIIGNHILQIGWTDGFSYIPLVNRMVASKHIIGEIRTNIDHRTYGGKIRKDLQRTKPELVVKGCKSIVANEIPVSHVLMDSWFYSEDLINQLQGLGLESIIRLKSNITFSDANTGELPTNLKTLYRRASEVQIPGSKGLIKEINVLTKSGKEMKLVFVPNISMQPNKNDKNNFIGIISSDLSLSAEQITTLYLRRWSIETNFRIEKQFLGLGKECQAQNFDPINAFVNLSSLRYIVLEIMRRLQIDGKSLGLIFMDQAEYLQEKTFVDAIRLIKSMLEELPKEIEKNVFGWVKKIVAKNPKTKISQIEYDELSNGIYKSFEKAINGTFEFISNLFGTEV